MKALLNQLKLFAPAVLLGALVGVGGCQTGLQADAGRQDEAILASDRVQRMDRGIPEGASSNPANDSGFGRPSGSSGTYGNVPFP